MVTNGVQLNNSVAPEPEGSSSYLQQPVTGLYPERSESTPPPPPPAYVRKIRSDPILSCTS
jgi:hypothetical protein